MLNTATDLVSGTVKIPQGPPQFVSFSPDSRTAYVSVYNPSGSVHLIAFIDTATGTVTSTVQVDNFTPGPSTTSPDGRFLYVPNHNTAMSGAHENVVDVIDTATKKLIGKIAVPANPHWVAFGKNGRCFTPRTTCPPRSRSSTASDQRIVTEIEVGETPHSEAISPDGSRLAVTSFDGNEVFVINTATDKCRDDPGREEPAGHRVLAGRALPLHGEQRGQHGHGDRHRRQPRHRHVPTGKAPTSISVLPNGRQAYVTDENDGTVEVLNMPKS